MIMLANDTMEPKPLQSASIDTALRRFRILVVDDNHDSALSLAMVLTMMGHETRTAHDGETALATAESFHPDVVLLDIGLPKMNGYEVAQRIRESAWGTTMFLIAVTGWGQAEDRARSAEVGLNMHMVKPVEPTALQAVLADLHRNGNGFAPS
ncbi:MAG: response regulator [Acidobacteriota bacterium]|nr:response regulator [Acidobacteriota bacterium]